jgi:hypothetical protein
MKELEICGVNDYVNEFLNSHAESDDSIIDITYCISLLGENFTEDGDLEYNGYNKVIGESKDLSEAKQIAISLKNTRLTLDTDSDVVMVQVLSIAKIEYPDHDEQFIGREYTAQVEFMKGKEK